MMLDEREVTRSGTGEADIICSKQGSQRYAMHIWGPDTFGKTPVPVKFMLANLGVPKYLESYYETVQFYDM